MFKWFKRKKRENVHNLQELKNKFITSVQHEEGFSDENATTLSKLLLECSDDKYISIDKRITKIYSDLA